MESIELWVGLGPVVICKQVTELPQILLETAFRSFSRYLSVFLVSLSSRQADVALVVEVVRLEDGKHGSRDLARIALPLRTERAPAGIENFSVNVDAVERANLGHFSDQHLGLGLVVNCDLKRRQVDHLLHHCNELGVGRQRVVEQVERCTCGEHLG